MHKTLIAVAILIIVSAGLYYVLTQYTPNPDALSGSEEQVPGGSGFFGEDGEVRGTIVLINTEQAAVDGPYLITIRQMNGETAVIAVPSMGLPTCAARENITDIYALVPGQTVAVRGSVGEGGMIIPCESAEHYLSLIEPS